MQTNNINKSSILAPDNNVSKEPRPQYNLELSQRYSIDSIDHHRKRNPNFLNSLLWMIKKLIYCKRYNLVHKFTQGHFWGLLYGFASLSLSPFIYNIY